MSKALLAVQNNLNDAIGRVMVSLQEISTYGFNCKQNAP